VSQNYANSLFLQPLTNAQGLVDPVSAWGQALNNLIANAVLFVEGTHAQRLATPAGNYDQGTLFFETERQLLYIAIAGQWFYFAGILYTTQDSLPTDLLPSDLNLRVYVTDFAHELNWSGTQWQWAPADPGSGFVLPFLNPPLPGVGWQVCDGTTNVSNLNGDGSLSFADVPTTAGSYYRQ
jgi:hypothetical protein